MGWRVRALRRSSPLALIETPSATEFNCPVPPADINPVCLRRLAWSSTRCRTGGAPCRPARIDSVHEHPGSGDEVNRPNRRAASPHRCPGPVAERDAQGASRQASEDAHGPGSAFSPARKVAKLRRAPATSASCRRPGPGPGPGHRQSQGDHTGAEVNQPEQELPDQRSGSRLLSTRTAFRLPACPSGHLPSCRSPRGREQPASPRRSSFRRLEPLDRSRY